MVSFGYDFNFVVIPSSGKIFLRCPIFSFFDELLIFHIRVTADYLDLFVL